MTLATPAASTGARIRSLLVSVLSTIVTIAGLFGIAVCVAIIGVPSDVVVRLFAGAALFVLASALGLPEATGDWVARAVSSYRAARRRQEAADEQ